MTPTNGPITQIVLVFGGYATLTSPQFGAGLPLRLQEDGVAKWEPN